MLNLNQETLAAVAEQACRDAAQHGRWLVAIGRALVELDANPWIARIEGGRGLLIGSPSGSVYSSNGVCQCKAFEHGQACWHRAAARLVRLHDEKEAAASIEAQITTVVDRAIAPLHERLAKAKAEMDELFA